MTGSDTGPYYTVLGTNKAGVYEGVRPPNTALGAPKALLPIVVVTTNRQDAETIFKLQTEIFDKINAADDAHTMVYLLQRPPASTLDSLLEVQSPIMAVRFGLETGVYLGYKWSAMERFVEPPPSGKKTYTPRWSGFERVADALIFMLKKPGVNLPLVPAGAPYPPPPSRTKQLRFDFSGIPEPENNEVSGTPTRAASPVKSAMVSSSRAASPVKSAAGAGAAGASTSRANPFQQMDDLSAAFRDLLGTSPGLELLRRLVRVPPTMGGSVNPRLPPLIFGETADMLFLHSGLDAYELLTLLQVRVHACTVESFTHHVGLMLGWSTRDAARIWDLMKLPEL